MRRARTLATVALGSAVLLPFVGAGTAMAADGDVMANLKPVALNGVDASGTAMVRCAAPPSTSPWPRWACCPTPHAAHIHFAADARHECPTPATTPTRTASSTRPRAARLRADRRVPDQDR